MKVIKVMDEIKLLSFQLGAIWALTQITKKLPLTSDEPSADLMYYMDKIREKLKKKKTM